jgi:S-DNA-T family DNA segregation ATPase FtsK/SpoIIIE
MPSADDNLDQDGLSLILPRFRSRQNTALRAQRMTMDRSRLKLDLVALFLFFALVFFAISLLSYDPADPPSTFIWPANDPVQNLCGTAGAMLAYGTLAGLGAGVYVFMLGLVCLNILIFARHRVSDPLLRLLGWVLLVLDTSALADKLVPG